jgi:hypothetical protein
MKTKYSAKEHLLDAAEFEFGDFSYEDWTPAVRNQMAQQGLYLVAMSLMTEKEAADLLATVDEPDEDATEDKATMVISDAISEMMYELKGVLADAGYAIPEPEPVEAAESKPTEEGVKTCFHCGAFPVVDGKCLHCGYRE